MFVNKCYNPMRKGTRVTRLCEFGCPQHKTDAHVGGGGNNKMAMYKRGPQVCESKILSDAQSSSNSNEAQVCMQETQARAHVHHRLLLPTKLTQESTDFPTHWCETRPPGRLGVHVCSKTPMYRKDIRKALESKLCIVESRKPRCPPHRFHRVALCTCLMKPYVRSGTSTGQVSSPFPSVCKETWFSDRWWIHPIPLIP